MKSRIMLCGVILIGMSVVGCGTTEIYDDPENQKDDVRNEWSYTSTEIRKAANKVLNRLLADDDFNEYINEYKAANGGKRPFITIAPLKNETDDPDLTAQVSELNSFIENKMRTSKMVRISRYGGVEHIDTIRKSRNLIDDDNVRQDSVAKEGTVEAAKLLIRPHLSSNNVSDGRRKRITRTFMIDVVRIDTGEAIFTSTEQLGFMKEKGTFGW